MKKRSKKAMKEEFKLYKGLQRPLVFKAFKGKYIYWALGSIVAGIVLGGIASSVVSSFVGLLTTAAVTTPLMMYTIAQQKKGLYHKKSDKTTYVVSPNFLDYTKKFKEEKNENV